MTDRANANRQPANAKRNGGLASTLGFCIFGTMTRPSGRIVPLIVAVAFFMENFDGTAIATALPKMASSFGVSAIDLSNGITAYLVTLAVFIPISGWCADRFGARSVFSAAIAVFSVASILCGISTGAVQFVLSRILQGIGGAMMVPVGRMVVLRSTPKKDLIPAIGTIVWPGLIATVIGPPVGGILTTYASWRWIFLVNIPIGVIGILLVQRFVENFRADEKRPLDFVGFVLSASALSCFMYGVDLLGRESSRGFLGWIFLGLTVVLGALTFWYEQRVTAPLVRFSLLKIPTFATTLIAGNASCTAVGAAPLLLPLMFQNGFGLSPAHAGILVLFYAGGNLGMKAMTTQILRRFGFRSVLVVNTLLIAFFAAASGFLTVGTPVLVSVIVLFGAGLVRSMQFTSLNTLAFSEVPTEEISAASMMHSAAQQLTFGLGIAFGAISLRIGILLGGADQTLAEFRIAFCIVAALALATFPAFMRLAHDAGAEVSGRTKEQGKFADEESG
jgi:EmrB/QacA subfamily drug resistance transporter